MLSLYLAALNSEEKSRFEELYYQHRQTMYNVAYGILKDVQYSEDAVHEAFLSLSRNMQKTTSMNCNQIRSYLIIIVRNAALRILNKLQKEICAETLCDNTPDLQNVEIDVENRSRQQHLIGLLRTLDPKYADVLILRYFFCMKNKEIADVLGISENNVKIRLHRGKIQLKEKIIGEDLRDGAKI